MVTEHCVARRVSRGETKSTSRSPNVKTVVQIDATMRWALSREDRRASTRLRSQVLVSGFSLSGSRTFCWVRSVWCVSLAHRSVNTFR